MLRKFIKNFLLITIPVFSICFLIAELVVFRFFIPACNPPHYYFDPQFHLLHFVPNTAGLYTDGRFAEVRGHWRSNNYGWNSEIDYVPGIGRKQPLVAIIGDSYVEGLQVDVNQRFPAVLRRLLGKEPLVYSFGISGAPLSQYLQMTRYVDLLFQPQTLVILVVHNDFDESLANLRSKPLFMQLIPKNGTFAEVPATPLKSSPLLNLSRQSAIFRYVELNCSVSAKIRDLVLKMTQPERHPLYNANIDVSAVDRERNLIRRSTDFLVAKIRAENPKKRIIIMMDAPRFDIYSHNLAHSNVKWLHELMRDACRRYGVEFLDLTGPFAACFEKSHQTMENWVNAHWNRLGHEVAAKALFEKLQESDRSRPLKPH
jgi:lysophospholipase L1-like esterase